MYKIIIVDDEEIIRKGLCKFINWESMGFDVAASFEDGKETIEYLKTHACDIVLTDIAMFEVSGIDIAKYIYENHLKTKVIFLSGYKEFDYAKTALEYGVSAYLLKPIQNEEVYKVIRKIKVSLNKENESSQLLKYEVENVLKAVVNGDFKNIEDLERKLNLLSMNAIPDTFPCCFYNISQTEKSDREFLHSFAELIPSQNNDIIYLHFTDANNLTINLLALASVNVDKTSLQEASTDYLGKIRKSYRSFFSEDTKVEFIGSFTNIYDFARYEYKNKHQDNECYPAISDVVNQDSFKENIKKYELFMTNLCAGNKNGLNELVDSMIDSAKHLPIEYVRRLMVDLFSAVNSRFFSMDIDLWQLSEGKFDWRNINNCMDIVSIRQCSMNMINQILTSINNNRKEPTTLIIKKAKEYINRNIHRDVSMSKVANHVYLNPVYFSRYFKQQTGENFVDYILKVRMEKAMKLLHENKYKISEICEMVGYSNSRYFIRLFKKYTGCTTTDYRRNLLNANDIYENE